MSSTTHQPQARHAVRTKRTATTATDPEEAVHETNNEAHDAFKKELEARPDWRTPIVKYIKDGELPTERWEARKIKARSSRYCIMDEKLYKRSLDEPYLLPVSPKDAFTILNKLMEDYAEATLAGDPY